MFKWIFLLSTLFATPVVNAIPESGLSVYPYIGLEAHWRDTGYRELIPRKFNGDPVFNQVVGDDPKDMVPPEKHGSLYAPNVHLVGGIKFNDYWGIEGGLQSSLKKRAHKKHMISGYHVGLNGYLPVTKTFRAVGSAGVSHLKSAFERNGNGFYKINICKVVPRLLGGFEQDISETVSLRASAVWEKTGNIKNKEVKNRNSLSFNFGIIKFF